MKRIALIVLMLPILINAQCWTSISMEAEQSSALKADGSCWVWGKNNYGELGIGTSGLRSVPTLQPSGLTWTEVSLGYRHALAIKVDGTLWGWGSNASGQLGLGQTTASYYSPVQIGTSADWLYVSTKQYSSFGIRSNGTLWGWGENTSNQIPGQFGSQVYQPAQIGIDSDWHIVNAGYTHTMAIKDDHTLWGWGANNGGNDYSQVGTGNTLYVFNPTQIGTDHDWVDVDTGEKFTLALKTDGTLWSWGENSHGQLGNGTTDPQYAPAQIGTDNNWESVSAGLWTSAAIKTDGTLWTWGYNSAGQLGNGAMDMGGLSEHPIPVQVGIDTDWIKVSCGQTFIAALRSDGSLWTWGENDSGQLGMGNFGGFDVCLTIPTLLGGCQIMENNAVSEISFSVFPNPVKDYLQYSNPCVLTVDVYDMQGRLLKSLSKNERGADFSGIVRGSYILRIYTADGIFTAKILKE